MSTSTDPAGIRREAGAEAPAPAVRPRFWLAQLVGTLAVSDLRLRYGRGPLRLAKWLLDPFAFVGVYLVLVGLVFARPGFAPGLSITCAIVPFQLITSSLSNAVWAVQARRAMIANMRFPITLVPLVGTVTESMAFAASFSIFVIMMAVYGVAPTLALAWLPVVVLVNFALAVAVSYVTSLIGMWAPELTSFLSSFVRALFFLAAGLVPLAQIHGTIRTVVELNPLTGVFESYRAVFMYGHSPAAWQLLWPAAVAVMVLGIVLPVYHRDQRHFPKLLE